MGRKLRQLTGTRVFKYRPQEVVLTDPSLTIEWNREDGITAVWLGEENILHRLSALEIETAEEFLAEEYNVGTEE